MMRILPIPAILFITNFYPVQSSDTTSTVNWVQTYANVSAAIAKYFSSACIYLLTHSNEQDILLLTMTSKYISSVYVRPNVVTSFDDYYHMINTTAPLDRCYVPLQVILDPDDEPSFKNAFSIHSQRTSMHGTDQYGGGVWLLFLKSFDPEFVDNYFKSIYLPFDVELIVAWIDTKEKLVHLKEAYRVVPAYPLRQPYLGNWSTITGLQAPRDPLHYSRRTDLEGLPMRVGYVDYPPIVILHKGRNDQIMLGGYFGDIWKVLEDAMNASSDLALSEEFGEYLIASDTWTGLLGEIKYNKVDVAVADFILTRNRFEHMDFSFPLIVTTFQVFYQFPGSKMEANSIFLPFSYDVWMTLGAWILIGSIVLYGGCYLTDTYLKTDENLEISKSLFFILGALCGQGANDMPKKVSLRILFILTHLITSVLIPAYSAALISYLTVMPPLIPFNSMREFYSEGQYKMTVRKGSYEQDVFAYGSADDPSWKKIYERDLKDNPSLPKVYKDAVPILCEDKHKAFFGVDDTMQWILDRAEHQEKKLKDCRITKMQHDAGSVTVGMVFPKKSHFKGLVNHHIRNFQSIGIMERLRKYYWTEFDKLVGEEWSPVNIENIIMIYVILGSGFVFGFGIFFMERFNRLFISKIDLSKKPLIDTSPASKFAAAANFHYNFRPKHIQKY